MVNNGGDIGKTLAQMGSEQSIKGLLTTMMTAGALSQLNETFFKDSNVNSNGDSVSYNGQGGEAATGNNAISTVQDAAKFQQNLLKNITNNIAGSAIDAAINGKAFDEKTLTSALSSALIATDMASVAKGIGDAKDVGDLNGFTQAVAHAALGCAAGSAIAGNSSGCSPGAVGAVVGELAADYAVKNGASRADAIAFAKVFAAAAGLIAGGGGDNVAAVNIANTTGENAAANNRGLHISEAEKLASLKQGKTQAQQDRLDAAACALVHCADGVPDSDVNKSKLLAMQTAGANYSAELQALAKTGEFVYATLDPVRDTLTRNGEVLKRAGGLVNLAAGTTGTVAGGVIAAGGVVGCPTTGVACAAVPVGVGLAAMSANQAQDGTRALTGSYTSTEGQRVLDSFNPSTYPGDRDPIATGLVDAAKLAATAALAKVIPKGLAALEGVEVAPAVKTVGANGGAAATVITPEMEIQILFGERVTNASGTPTNRLIGAHGGEIANSNPNYAVEVLSVNVDGTRNAKLLTQFSDGNVSNIKTSTLFPENWTPSQSIGAVKQVGDMVPVATRADGAALYQSTVNGVQIEVIKVGSNVTAGYPVGSRGFQTKTYFLTGKN